MSFPRELMTLKAGKALFEFGTLTGVVVDSSKHSETNVYGGGGGGYSYQGTGSSYVNPVQSDVVRTHEFWIRDENGKEHSIRLDSHHIQLRGGQMITLVFVGTEKSGHNWAALYNHASETWWWITSPDWFLEDQAPLWYKTDKSIIVFVVTTIVMVYVLVGLFYVVGVVDELDRVLGTSGLIGLSAVVSYFLLKRNVPKHKRRIELFREHMKRIISNL